MDFSTPEYVWCMGMHDSKWLTVVKSGLSAQMVADEVLQTLFTGLEKILHGRALMANSDDVNDLEPVTPTQFLMQRKVLLIAPGVFEKIGMYRKK